MGLTADFDPFSTRRNLAFGKLLVLCLTSSLVPLLHLFLEYNYYRATNILLCVDVGKDKNKLARHEIREHGFIKAVLGLYCRSKFVSFLVIYLFIFLSFWEDDMSMIYQICVLMTRNTVITIILGPLHEKTPKTTNQKERLICANVKEHKYLIYNHGISLTSQNYCSILADPIQPKYLLRNQPFYRHDKSQKKDNPKTSSILPKNPIDTTRELLSM